MKGGLGRVVDIFGSDWARAAGRATERRAFQTRGVANKRPTADHIKAVRPEGVDRAGGQTGLRCAGFARALAGRRVVSRYGEFKRECRTIGVPKAELRVNEETDGRLMHETSGDCPTAEWRVRRAAERIDGFGAKAKCDLIDDILSPTV